MLKKRFVGEKGRRLLADALLRQAISLGSRDLAAALAERVVLDELETGHVFIRQGADDNDIYFILSGRVGIEVNDRQIAERTADQHVGEMALIDSGARRSASVRCLAPTVTAKVTEADFTELADGNPGMWRRLALELARRLLERNKHVPSKNAYPQVFVGSSGKAASIAADIRDKIETRSTKVFLWFDNVFTASKTTIETLEEKAKENDFAVLVLNADDVAEIKEKIEIIPRDNVVFELGLFMGALGRNRTIMVVPEGCDVKLPTDLLGVTVLFFGKDEKTGRPLLDDVCEEIQKHIVGLGSK